MLPSCFTANASTLPTQLESPHHFPDKNQPSRQPVEPMAPQDGQDLRTKARHQSRVIGRAE